MAGRRSTDVEDLPAGKAVYANRDTGWLLRQAAIDGEAIGVVAARLLDVELPWTRMRQVYRLLGLVRRYGAGPRVDDACAKALEVDCIDVGVVSRMLERAAAGGPPASSGGPAPPAAFRPPPKRAGRRPMNPTAPTIARSETISADLRQVLRNLELSAISDTLPDGSPWPPPPTWPTRTS